MMYLVSDNSYGVRNLVFTWQDPGKAGFSGEVIDGVSLDYDMDSVHSWPDGQLRPEACVGRSKKNPKHFKVFKYRTDLQAADFEPIPGTAVVFGSWQDYSQVKRAPETLRTADEELFFDYLDKVDENIRERKKLPEKPDDPKSTNRDDVAVWVAKQHMIVDRSIREVWYLPSAAPANEIRFLEVNDRFEGPDTAIEPLDFGVDVQGANFQVLVADVTSEQIEQVKLNRQSLPKGWTVDGHKVWRRREA